MNGLTGYRIALIFALFALSLFPLSPVPPQRRSPVPSPKRRSPVPSLTRISPRQKKRASPPMASPSSSRASKKVWGEEGELDDVARPRSFDAKARAKCWQKADVITGRHPERWRRDPAGNVVCKRFWNCHGCLCYEYDHIVPFSKGGESTADNCQILQTRVNRLKSNKEWVDKKELEGFSCDIKFTDKEMDVIEMAVYGDVIRPGKECRCRTVAEMLGQVKMKKNVKACELPYKESNS